METIPLTGRFAYVQEIYQILFPKKENYPSCPNKKAHTDREIPLPYVKEGLFCQLCGATIESFELLKEEIDPARIMAQLEEFLSLFRILNFKPHHTLEEDVFDENYFTFLEVPFITYAPDSNLILVKLFELNIQKLSFTNILSLIFQEEDIIGAKLRLNERVIPFSESIEEISMKEVIIDLVQPRLNQLLMDWFEKSNTNYEAFDT